MRKCVFFFFLLVFVLIIASITENREREAAVQSVAMENSKQELSLQDNTTPGKDLSK